MAHSITSDTSPTHIARLHGISTGQLYTWRSALTAAQLTRGSQTIARFARVELAPRPFQPHDPDAGG